MELVSIHKPTWATLQNAYVIIYLLDNQLFASPHTTGDPEPAVDKLGVAFVCGLDGGKSPKAVLSGIDVLLGFPGAKQSI